MSESHLGLGVLINMLGGNEETVGAVKSSIGKTIKSATLDNDRLRFEFSDGSQLVVWDDGQSCCENRYMVTADRLNEFTDATLLGMEIKTAPDIQDGHESHEIQFLDVKTSKGVFQMATHNEHNGYYGGFWIKAAATEAKQ